MEIFPFKAPAHDNHRHSPSRVALVEVSALEKRNSHRGKVSRRHETAFEGRRLIEWIAIHFDLTNGFATA